MFEDLIICDSSPLILLSKIGALDLLTSAARRVMVPRAVWNEVMNPRTIRPEIEQIRISLAGAVTDADQALANAYAFQVDAGEAEALALATHHPQGVLLMDDAKGRRVALASGFRIFGTLGLIVRARRNGQIAAAKPYLDRLLEHGLFVTPNLIAQALKSCGEGQMA
jgi:predicted nucleic acid-binding protein